LSKGGTKAETAPQIIDKTEKDRRRRARRDAGSADFLPAGLDGKPPAG